MALVSLLLVSGCVSMDPTSMVKATPAVSKFLEDYPNAEVKALHYTAEESAAIVGQVKSDCEKESVTPKEYYKVTINDADSGLSVVAWVDVRSNFVECVVKKGSSGEIIDDGDGSDCITQSEKRCYGGHLYWYDSCGNRGEKKQACGYGCQNGACVNTDEDDCTATVEAGSSVTVTTGGEDYVITVVGVGENNDAVIDIDGEQFDVDTDANGEVDFTKDGLIVHVKSVSAVKYPVETGYVKMEYNCETSCLNKQQAKCYEGHVYWYDSCGNRQEKKEYCNYGCEAGTCKSAPVPANCTDSDGGYDIYEAGTATASGQSLSDHCNGDGTLTEKYCENNAIVAVSVACPSGYTCENAACVTPDVVCESHSYSGCYGDHVYWFDSCGSKEEKKIDCPYGCENNACKSVPTPASTCQAMLPTWALKNPKKHYNCTLYEGGSVNVGGNVIGLTEVSSLTTSGVQLTAASLKVDGESFQINKQLPYASISKNDIFVIPTDIVSVSGGYDYVTLNAYQSYCNGTYPVDSCLVHVSTSVNQTLNSTVRKIELLGINDEKYEAVFSIGNEGFDTGLNEPFVIDGVEYVMKSMTLFRYPYTEFSVILEASCPDKYEARCYNNYAYWYDSCGQRREVKGYCTEGCYMGTCVNCTESIETGSSTTVTVGGDEYVITVVGVGENNDAVIDINGEQFDVDTDDASSLDVTKDDLSIHVKAIYAVKYPVETGYVYVQYNCED